MGRAFFAGMGAAFMFVLGGAAFVGLGYLAIRESARKTLARASVAADALDVIRKFTTRD